MRKFIGIILILTSSYGAVAQFGMSPLNPGHTPLVRDHIAKQKTTQQTACWPFILPADELDSLADADTKNWTRKEYEMWVMRKLRNEHLIEIREPDFSLNLDAGFNLEGARQLDDQGRRMYTNTRGIQVTGTVGKRAFFGSSFYENQSIFPNYLDSIVSKRGDFNNEADPERGSVPGYGRWKPFNTSDSYDYDYTLGTGYVGVALGKRSFIQLGHDKQFIGYGHRSLFLSDVSAPYPFLRTHLSFFEGKLTYSETWAVLQSLERIAPNYNDKEAMFRRLGGRFSYLHFQATSWLGLGFFNGTTWKWRDNNHPSDISFYMPLGGVYAPSGTRNQLSGLNAEVRPISWLSMYGQFGMNHRGGELAQLGLRVADLIPGLNVRLEYNRIGNNAYFNELGNNLVIQEPFLMTDALDYYQHNDQGLGHPFLVNVNEVLVHMRYRWRDFFASGVYHNFNRVTSYGQTGIDLFQFEAGYIINPRSNAQIVIGNINRTERRATTSSLDTYNYFAFRTQLFNTYRDF